MTCSASAGAGACIGNAGRSGSAAAEGDDGPTTVAADSDERPATDVVAPVGVDGASVVIGTVTPRPSAGRGDSRPSVSTAGVNVGTKAGANDSAARPAAVAGGTEVPAPRGIAGTADARLAPVSGTPCRRSMVAGTDAITADCANGGGDATSGADISPAPGGDDRPAVETGPGTAAFEGIGNTAATDAEVEVEVEVAVAVAVAVAVGADAESDAAPPPDADADADADTMPDDRGPGAAVGVAGGGVDGAEAVKPNGGALTAAPSDTATSAGDDGGSSAAAGNRSWPIRNAASRSPASSAAISRGSVAGDEVTGADAVDTAIPGNAADSASGSPAASPAAQYDRKLPKAPAAGGAVTAAGLPAVVAAIRSMPVAMTGC